MIISRSGFVRRWILVVGILPFCIRVGGMETYADSGIQVNRGGANARITDLHIFKDPEIVTEVQGEMLEESVLIQGAYRRKDWNLIIGKIKLVRNEQGQFIIKTKLSGPKKILLVAAVGPDGTVQTEQLQILYPDWRPKRLIRWGLSAGLGLTALHYSETPTSLSSGVNISETALTAKASGQYRFAPPRWDLGATVFGTTAVFTSSIPGSTIRFLGANLRVGYELTDLSNPWSVILMGGLYYTTTFVNPGTHDLFGFANLMGPQLFPVVRRSLDNGDSVSGYLKYSPVGNGGFTLMVLTSRELAGGVTYDHLLKNTHYLPISLDIANLQTDIEGSHVDSTSATLSAGYSF